MKIITLLKNACQSVAFICFSLLLVGLLMMLIILPVESREPPKVHFTPQQELALRHHSEIKMHMKNPVGFKVTYSTIYFEGKDIVSCMKYKANEKDWHSVLIKRRVKHVFKTTDAAWQKHCANRQMTDFKSFLTSNTTSDD